MLDTRELADVLAWQNHYRNVRAVINIVTCIMGKEIRRSLR
jgi:hypothetical protein